MLRTVEQELSRPRVDAIGSVNAGLISGLKAWQAQRGSLASQWVWMMAGEVNFSGAGTGTAGQSAMHKDDMKLVQHVMQESP